MVLLSTNCAFVSFAQENIAPKESITFQAMRDAEIDVESNFDTPIWFLIGCVFPAAGVLSTYFIEPVVPADRLIGKSLEYVAHYTDTYRRGMKKRQSDTAIKGCLVGSAISGGLFVISTAIQTGNF